jgi:hypothetical protein
LRRRSPRPAPAELMLFDMSEASAERAGRAPARELSAMKVATGSKDPAGFDVVVNATPLGMKEGDPLPFDVDRIDPNTFVGEVVMKTEFTPLLQAAKSQGLPGAGRHRHAVRDDSGVPGVLRLRHSVPRGIACRGPIEVLKDQVNCMSIFEGFLSTSETLGAFSDRAFVDAMLRFEAALARAQAAEGLIPESAAHSIVGSCKVELFDVAKIVRESGRAGSVAIPLVKALREAVGLFNADAAPFVHFGSTSQDVIDSAMALVTREAVALIETDLAKAADACCAWPPRMPKRRCSRAR